MTNKEAIELNKNLMEYMRITGRKSEYKFLEDNYIALKMGIKALEQEPKWIPISERLPEEKQSVLVWCPEYKNMYCAYLENKNWWIFGAFSQIIPNAVIAWMPLPEPYKAESEEI